MRNASPSLWPTAPAGIGIALLHVPQERRLGFLGFAHCFAATG